MPNYVQFLSRVSSARKSSVIRDLLKRLQNAGPEMIPLSGGLPNPAMFPFKSASVVLSNDHEIRLDGEKLGSALQYVPSDGYAPLIAQLQRVQGHFHGVDDWSAYNLITTNGSQDGLCKAMEMLIDPGDHVITEDYTYLSIPTMLNPLGARYVVVEGDQGGMRPDKLWEGLRKRWRPGDAGTPKLMYLNPTGSNPTGAVMTPERRQEIYEICSAYDVLILEDDPYYFMQFRDEGEGRVPSFLSVDEDQRVIRFDSFSKVLSSGIRLGFMTGPKPLVDRILLHVQVSVLHASSLSQVIISELLSQWDIEGLEKHINEVEDFYRARRDAMHTAASKHLTGLCEWSLPRGGMFLWIKVDGVSDTWDMVMERGAAKNIMLVPGKLFSPSEDVMLTESPYVRASYSIADVSKFDLAFERLAELIREEKSMIRLKNDVNEDWEVGQRRVPRQQVRQQLYNSQKSLWENNNRGGVSIGRQNAAAPMMAEQRISSARYKSS